MKFKIRACPNPFDFAYGWGGLLRVSLRFSNPFLHQGASAKKAVPCPSHPSRLIKNFVFSALSFLAFFTFSQETTIPKDTLPSPFQKLLKKMKYKWINDALWQTGNVERFLYNTSLQWLYNDSIFDYEIKPRFSYGEVTQKQNDKLIRGVVQEREQILDLHFGFLSQKRFYGFSFGTFEKSNLRNINLRWLVGFGAGWHIIRTKNEHQRINLTTAILREGTDFINPNQPDYQVFRISIRLKGNHIFFKNRLKLSHMTTFLPSLAFNNNKRLVSNLTIEVPISKRIQLRSSFDYTYEGIVPPNVKKTDTRNLVGLVIANF